MTKSSNTISPESLQEIINKLAHEDKALQAIKELVGIGKPAVPTLIKALEYEDFDIRWGVIIALGEIGPEAEEADGRLYRAVQRSSPVAQERAGRPDREGASVVQSGQQHARL